MSRIAFVAALAFVVGCAAPTRTAPPPLVDRGTSAVSGPDPIAHDDARAAFDALPASREAGAAVPAADRPSAMPLLEMTLPPAKPIDVARVEASDGPTNVSADFDRDGTAPMPDDALRALDAQPRPRRTPVAVAAPAA